MVSIRLLISNYYIIEIGQNTKSPGDLRRLADFHTLVKKKKKSANAVVKNSQGIIIMDKRKRKLMGMHQALHPRDDVDKLYVKKTRRKRTRQH